MNNSRIGKLESRKDELENGELWGLKPEDKIELQEIKLELKLYYGDKIRKEKGEKARKT